VDPLEYPSEAPERTETGFPEDSDAADTLESRPRYVHPDYPALDCVYCGETAEDKDHLLPRSWTGDAGRKLVPVVPSCHECNATLGDRHMPDVMDRRNYVQERYRVKYSKALKAVLYGPTDLEEFGPSLRNAIIELMDEHHRIVRRLAWPMDPEYDHQAWKHAWESDHE
jgi:hypothetical protein